MPNRILKESIRTSKNINALTDFQFRVWSYLVTYVDDYGRGSADPELLKGIVFTRRKGVTESQIEKALNELANKGMIVLYESDGDLYFYFPKWDEHQRIRNKRSKFPDPEACQRVAVKCQQDADRIQSESKYRIQNPNPTIYCTEQSNDSSMPVYSLPLNDGSFYDIAQEQYNKWLELYPAVDVMSELRKMRGWLDSNPKRKKTRQGILRFINHWLSSAQDSPHFDKRREEPVDLLSKIREMEEQSAETGCNETDIFAQAGLSGPIQ